MRRLRPLLLIIVLLLATSHMAAAADIETYLAWLAREENILRRMEQACASSGGTSLGPLSTARTLSRSPGGNIDAAQTAWLLRELDAIAEAPAVSRLAMIHETLSLLAAYRALLTTPAPSGSNAGSAAAVLEGVLAADEFSWKTPQRTIWQKIWDTVKDWGGRLLYGGGRIAVRIFEGLLILGGFLLLYLIFRAIYKRSRAEAFPSADHGPSSTNVSSWQGLLHEAEETAKNGGFREALRLLYLSLLSELDRTGRIRIKEHRTNREYRREIENTDSGLAAVFTPFTELFETKWYGREECSQADYEQAKTWWNMAERKVR